MAQAAARDTTTAGHVEVFRRIQELLGVTRLASENDLVRLVERGVPPQAVDSLRQHGLRDDEVYALLLPRRTLAHRRVRREALSRDESDRVVRVARIAAFCEQVFGEPERAWRWLREGKRQFQGRSPLELSSTDAGARVVEAWLYRIDDGMVA